MSPPLASPSPIMGAVRLFLFPFLSSVPLLVPHSQFVVQWEASDDLGCPLISPPVGLARGVCAAARGVPPPPPLGQGFTPYPLLQALCEERNFLIGGYPPSSVPWLRNMRAR